MTRPDEKSPDLLSRTFVELADILVTDFDVVSFLQMLSSRCVGLFDVTAAGVMLQDPHDELQVVASSSEDARMLELLELQNQEGPCLEAFHQSRAVQAHSPESDRRWPVFAEHADAFGFRVFTAVPLRLRSRTIGALNLFAQRGDVLSVDQLRNAQALADIATMSLLNERALREGRVVAEQLQRALSSRVTLEQAKGILAVHLNVHVDVAFVAMRNFARNRNMRLSVVAQAVVNGDDVAREIRL